MAIIDADAHVIETDRTWDYFDEADLRYKPFTVTEPSDPTKQILGHRRENPRPAWEHRQGHLSRVAGDVGYPRSTSRHG